MTIEHTVVFRLHHAPGSDEEAAFLAAADAALAGIPGVQGFAARRQISAKSPLTWQLSMRFADAAAYARYDAHPSHVAFVAERWRPEVAEFQEHDFED